MRGVVVFLACIYFLFHWCLLASRVFLQIGSEPAKAMGCQVGGGGAKPAFDCNAALGNFARLQKTGAP